MEEPEAKLENRNRRKETSRAPFTLSLETQAERCSQTRRALLANAGVVEE